MYKIDIYLCISNIYKITAVKIFFSFFFFTIPSQRNSMETLWSKKMPFFSGNKIFLTKQFSMSTRSTKLMVLLLLNMLVYYLLFHLNTCTWPNESGMNKENLIWKTKIINRKHIWYGISSYRIFLIITIIIVVIIIIITQILSNSTMK